MNSTAKVTAIVNEGIRYTPESANVSRVHNLEIGDARFFPRTKLKGAVTLTTPEKRSRIVFVGGHCHSGWEDSTDSVIRRDSGWYTSRLINLKNRSRSQSSNREDLMLTKYCLRYGSH